MTWLTEDPAPLLVLLGLVGLVLAGVLYQTGRAVVLWPLAGVVLAAIGVFVVERLIVTERERVEQTIHAAAAALKANDIDGVLEFIGPDALELRTLVQSAVGRLTITEARITDRPEILINELTSPPTATAGFHAIVAAEHLGNYPVRVDLTLRRYDDRWKVVRFESDRPIPRR